MATVLVLLVTGLVVSLPAAFGAPGPPPPPGAIIVSNGSHSPARCSTPAYTSIQSAVTAAPAGSTIYVCAGTYNESVSIDKPLVLDGAQYSEDAGGPSRGLETVIDSSGGITYTTGATTGTISGFTLNGYTGGTGEIVASNVGSGWTFTNNVIDVSNGGIYLNTDGQTNPPLTTIKQNRFVQAIPSSASSGDFGQAVLVWANTGNNITIANNAFVNLTGPGAAINTTQAGDCGATPNATDFGNDLTISGNSFVDNGASGFYADNLVALFCTTNAQISQNKVTITDPNHDNPSTPIYLGGGNWSTTVDHNTLTGNGETFASGVVLNSDFYASGTGVVITHNNISGLLYGIHVRSGGFGDQGRGAGNTPSYFTISSNSVSGSVSDGIAIDEGLYGAISDNHVSHSTTYDCYDASGPGGPETSGTYDTWSHDVGQTSSPAGLCHT
jgi:hypothetical protein